MSSDICGGARPSCAALLCCTLPGGERNIGHSRNFGRAGFFGSAMALLQTHRATHTRSYPISLLAVTAALVLLFSYAHHRQWAPRPGTIRPSSRSVAHSAALTLEYGVFLAMLNKMKPLLRLLSGNCAKRSVSLRKNSHISAQSRTQIHHRSTPSSTACTTSHAGTVANRPSLATSIANSMEDV